MLTHPHIVQYISYSRTNSVFRVGYSVLIYEGGGGGRVEMYQTLFYYATNFNILSLLLSVLLIHVVHLILHYFKTDKFTRNDTNNCRKPKN